MTQPPTAPVEDRSWWLIVTAALVLTAFYYLWRADVIGVRGAGGNWTPMTGRPLPAWGHFVAAGLLLGVAPVAVARLVGLRPRDIGLGRGHLRLGMLLLIAGIPLALLAGWIGSGAPAMRAVYPLDPVAARANFPLYALGEFLYYGGWEVLFRGVLLFGLRKKLGDGGANALQMALAVTAHFGRAAAETMAAIPASLVFGYVTLKVGSVWYVALIHWVVGVSMEWFVLQ